MSSKPSAGHIEATVLHAILKRHAKNPLARFKALETVKRTPGSVTPSSKSRNAAVRLVKKNVDNNTPAIWLQPAEGTVPTMHYYSWCALDRPTPKENKIYINMDNVTRPSHRRGEHCEKCIVDAWQNASLRMMTMDFSKLETAGREKDNAKKDRKKQRCVSGKKAFGSLRESFQSRSRREEAGMPEPPKSAKRQDVSARRIWRT
ncbi:hypothetical protein E8E12_002947 [Didymella heteroderae]|uniref:Uncharacterized protein n=1 Tax=Didymella heteroderae TaxID=1769908 RepID=A0A9P4WL75_9PLEO|nr:hypothetical protein E8E12_002947 [Didymella heteroderae]